MHCESESLVKSAKFENEEMIIAVNAMRRSFLHFHFISFPQFIYDLFHISLTVHSLSSLFKLKCRQILVDYFVCHSQVQVAAMQLQQSGDKK